MKKFSIALILFLSAGRCFAQQGDLTYFNYNGKDLINFLITRIRYPEQMVNTCGMPMTYVKFKINNRNEVDSLTLTNDEYPVLKVEIAQKLALTNGHWKSNEIGNKWIIIPMLFFMISDNPPRKGCDYPSVIEKQQKQSELLYIPKNCIYFPILVKTLYVSEKRIR